MNPIIKTLPTEREVEQMVDRIITPELADAECRNLIRLLYAVADAENDEQWHLANTAARRAFNKTSDYENAFREFAGFPSIRIQNSAEGTMEIKREQ
jgi:hypothetical protein